MLDKQMRKEEQETVDTRVIIEWAGELFFFVYVFVFCIHFFLFICGYFYVRLPSRTSVALNVTSLAQTLPLVRDRENAEKNKERNEKRVNKI